MLNSFIAHKRKSVQVFFLNKKELVKSVGVFDPLYFSDVAVGERDVAVGEQLDLRENCSFPDNVSYMKNGHRQISYPLIYNSQRFFEEKKLCAGEALLDCRKLKCHLLKYVGLFGDICDNSFSI